MKAIFNLLIPVIVVAAIFMGSRIMQTNYDLRYLEQHSGIATVTSKEVIPAGAERRFVYVGKTLVNSTVTNQEEPTIYLNLQSSDTASIVSRKQYNAISIGQSVPVTYYEPKYYGNPFAVKVVNSE